MRLQKTVCHVDVNTYRTQLLAYKYLDQETRLRENNINIYGLDEREHDGVHIIDMLREFFSEQAFNRGRRIVYCVCPKVRQCQ